jgi:hypothetical protein
MQFFRDPPGLLRRGVNVREVRRRAGVWLIGTAGLSVGPWWLDERVKERNADSAIQFWKYKKLGRRAYTRIQAKVRRMNHTHTHGAGVLDTMIEETLWFLLSVSLYQWWWWPPPFQQEEERIDITSQSTFLLSSCYLFILSFSKIFIWMAFYFLICRGYFRFISFCSPS